MLLLLLTIEFTGFGNDVLQVTTRELAIMVILGVFLHVHIYATIADIGIAFVHDFLHKSNLLDDMTAGVWFDRWWQDVQQLHIAVIAIGEVLHYLHWFELLQAGFLGYLILAFIGIVLQVAYVCNVAHIAHLVAKVHQVAVEQIECDSRTRMPQVCITIHGRTADIHAYVSFMQGFEIFFLTR